MEVQKILKNFFVGEYEKFNLIILLILSSLVAINPWVAILVNIWIIVSLLFNKNTNYDIEVYIISVFLMTKYLTVVILLFHLIIDIFSKKIFIRKSFLIIFLILILYIFLIPIISNNFDGVLKYAPFMMMIMYCVAELKNLDFVKITKFYIYSTLILTVTSFIFQSFGCGIKYYGQHYYGKLLRFEGFCNNPNPFYKILGLGLIALYFLKVKDIISDREFFVFYAFVIFFSLLTLSRMFIITYILTTILFFVFYSRGHKNKINKFSLTFCGITILCLLVLFKYTQALILRFTNPYEESFMASSGLTEEEFEMVLNGELFYDPGRIGIWKLYFLQIFQSPKSFLFGYGILGPVIGKMYHAHNSAIEFMYRFGFVGYILLILLIISIIGFKNLRKVKKFATLLIYIVGVYSMILLDCNSAEMIPWLMLMLACKHIDCEAKINSSSTDECVNGYEKLQNNVKNQQKC